MPSSGSEHSRGMHKSTGFSHQHLKDTTTTKAMKQAARDGDFGAREPTAR